MSVLKNLILCSDEKKDREEIKDILEGHLAHPKTTIKGAQYLFEEFIGELLEEKHVEWFLTDLFALVGMEIEGKEVSVGCLYFGNTQRKVEQNLHFAKLGRKLSDTLCRKINFGNEGFTNYREVIRVLRDELIGWTSGRFLEPVLIFTEALPCLTDIKILMMKYGAKMKTGAPLTAHEIYSKITKDKASKCFAVWIKPAASVRFYKNGTFFGQIMRLRDAGGWTTRNIGRIVEIVSEISKLVGLPLKEGVCRKWIIEPSISMSESRRGCTIVVVKKHIFNEWEKNWKKRNPRVACEAKHAPIDKELEYPSTEAEYENYLAQDGAVVISSEGELLGMGTYFKGSDNPGGRKRTASWLPKVQQCLTIVTSQDGPIYLYWPPRGKPTKRETAPGVRLDFISRHNSKAISTEQKSK
jgi:hypothetical protein